MEKSYSESYAAAGVDITAGYRSVELMKQYVPVMRKPLKCFAMQLVFRRYALPAAVMSGTK